MNEYDDMMLNKPLPTEHIEHAILGALLTHPQAYDKVADKLTSESFVMSEHRKIYKAMQALASRNAPIDMTSVDHELKVTKVWDDKNCFVYLIELAKHNSGASNIVYYVDQLLKHSTIRALREVTQQIIAITDENIEPSAMLDKADGLIMGIQTTNVRGGGPQKIRDIMSEVLDSLDSDPVPPLSTGFTGLDELMDGGMRPGELLVIAGRPGQGKTTLGINIATNVAMQSPDNGVLIFSMEMTCQSLVERIFMAVAQVNCRKIRGGKPMTADEAVRIASAASRFQNNNIRIDETGAMNPSEIRARARRDSREFKNLKLIVVDYIQMMKADTKYELRATELGECSAALKTLAKELNIPIIALAQLNRNSVAKGVEVRRPNMADLKDSGSIEQDADMVALIHREDQYKEDSELKGLAEIIIDKQRSGMVGTFLMSFDGANSRFLNYRDYRHDGSAANY